MHILIPPAAPPPTEGVEWEKKILLRATLIHCLWVGWGTYCQDYMCISCFVALQADPIATATVERNNN